MCELIILAVLLPGALMLGFLCMPLVVVGLCILALGIGAAMLALLVHYLAFLTLAWFTSAEIYGSTSIQSQNARVLHLQTLGIDVGIVLLGIVVYAVREYYLQRVPASEALVPTKRSRRHNKV